MKKQEFLAKWQQLFEAYPFAQSINKELEDDLTSLLSDEDTARKIVENLDSYTMTIDVHSYGLPYGDDRELITQIVKNTLNELD